MATAATAAEPPVRLEVMAGQVMKQSELGFTLVKTGTALQSGDTLMLKDGSAAILNAGDSGCFVSLRKAGIYVVPNLADCVPGQAQVLPSQAVIEPANGVYEPVYPEPPVYPDIGIIPPPPPPHMAAAHGSGLLMAGGFASIVAAVTLYTTVIEEDEKAVSTH